MRDGTHQSQRLPVALDPGYFRVDELTLEQRVSMSAAHAARLQFFDLTCRAAGTWRELFDNDAALVMARILGVDVRALQRQFATDLAAGAPPMRLAAHIAMLASWFDLWMKSLHGHEDAAARRVLDCMEQMVELQLRELLRDAVLRGTSAAGEDDLQERRLQRLDARWRSSSPLALRSERIDHEVLRAALHTFICAIEQLQRLVREVLPACLASQTHEPAAGLLLAFLQLYQQMQAEINQFTARHTQFYYERCLRMQPRPAVADHVHLVCSREPRFTQDVVIARGTLFAAGKDGDGKPIEFEAQEDLLVSDARVAALHTLHFECDPLISPEREFGFVTRAKWQDIPIDAAGDGDHSLFGAGAAADRAARLGMAIATPMLLLQEGAREIRISFALTHPQPQDANLTATRSHWQRSIDLVVQSETPLELQQRLGQVFSQWLLSTQAEFEPEQLAKIRATARRLFGARAEHDFGPHDPLGIIFGTQPPQRALIFDLVFRDLFDVHLSTATGWYASPDAHASMSADQVPQLVVRLPREAPAVVACSAAVHGAEWPAQPVVRIELEPQARMCAYSLLSQLSLSEIKVAVHVAGVRNLVLYNNLGRLDATRTLYPFGPLPTRSSYLVVGAPETAGKQLTGMLLQLEWSGLPRGRGGFAEYYAGYEQAPDTADFSLDLAVLSDGVWQLQEGSTPLFGTEGSGVVASESRVALEADFLRKYYKPELNDPFDYSSITRNGFVRLQLSGSEQAFGHALYPMLLTRVVSDNARLKHGQALPNPPYTPVLERVVLDYRAEINIALAQNAGPPQPRTHVLHLHPFGVEEIYQRRQVAMPALLPAYTHPGNLLIGIAARQLHGPLSLLFQLRAAAAEIAESRPQLHFAYLAHDRWCELSDAQLLSDTTAGFLTSGIVTLDLPAAIRADNRVLPAGLFWLRVAADHGFEAFASLAGVHAQALSARRRECRVGASPIPAGTITQPLRSIPGLQSVTQVGPSFGLRPFESGLELRTRTGERLRHKQRALTAWDYERLVLDHCSQIAKVKCFRLPAARHAEHAGGVLVVVIPATTTALQDPLLNPRVSAVELRRIEEYLQARSSPFVSVQARNAVYEYVQVRCTVELARGAPPGMSLRRINRCIVEHLSPWHPDGYPARFDWRARGEDVEAWIRSLDCVVAVSGLSLLHITQGARSRYRLADTARAAAPTGEVMIQPRSQYSVLIPTAQHLIELGAGSDAQPQVTGVANLTIGNTFIVGGP